MSGTNVATDRQRISRSRKTRRLAVITCVLLAVCLLPSPSSLVQAQSSPDVRFGAVEAFRDPAAAADLNLGWERILFYWSQLQRSGPDDAWNIYHVQDNWIADAAAHGRQVVGLIENTPAWATDGSPNIGVPRGLYLPIDDPGNLWATFVRQLVSRYVGRIDHWIIWNEPDIQPPDYGLQFEGSVADYYQLVKVAYLVAKQANPNAVIHLAGLTHHHDVVNKRTPYLQRFIDEAKKDPSARDNHFYFDVATLHIYFTTDSVYDITQLQYGILRRNGLSQPIWINETNSPPSIDPLNPWANPLFVTSLDQQADFMVQAFALGLAAGAQRIAVYKLVDFPAYEPGFEAYGLVRADATRRPAYDAIKVITTYFRDVRATRLVRSGAAEVVTLDRGAQTTRIAWARGAADTQLTLPAFAPSATLVAPDGVTRTVEAVNRQYQLTLPAARCDDPNYGCRLGGRPTILVEDAPADLAVAAAIQAGTVTPTAMPVCNDCTPAPAATPTRRPISISTETPTATATLTPSPTRTAPPTASPTATHTATPAATPTATAIAIAAAPPAAAQAVGAPSAVGEFSLGSLIGLLAIGLAVVVALIWLRPRRPRP